jgi:uncharacterized protein (TIGR02996 family)
MAHAELEARLIENPDDRDVLAVYADHLQSIGDPRGELIALQVAGKPAAQFIESHADALLGPLAEHVKSYDGMNQDAFTWANGFIKTARLSLDSNENSDVKLEDVLEQLLTHPSGKLLQELAVPINMLDDGMYFGPIVQILAKLGAPALRELHVGEFEHAGPGGWDNDYNYEISWTSLGDATGLWQALPRLERARLQVGLGGSSASGEGETIGELVAPKLRELEVVTGGMSAACLQAFANAKAPELESMDLWLGSDNYGATGTAADLEPLLAGAGVPKLRQLGIINSEIANTVIEPLANSRLLLQLVELDLAFGVLDDDGAQLLVANAKSFKHLKRIRLDKNCIGAASLEAIRAALPNAEIGTQKDEDTRYVSLSE